MIEDQIRDILFKIGLELKIHKLYNNEIIVEIDYEKYVSEIMQLINK
jgi:hypothetical protein